MVRSTGRKDDVIQRKKLGKQVLHCPRTYEDPFALQGGVH